LNAKTYAERKGFARQTIATPFEVITVKLDGIAALINAGRPKKAYTSFKAQPKWSAALNTMVWSFFLNYLLFSNQDRIRLHYFPSIGGHGQVIRNHSMRIKMLR
jgi:hypothetical protein